MSDRIKLKLGELELTADSIEIRTTPLEDLRTEIARRAVYKAPGVCVVSPSDTEAIALLNLHATPAGKRFIANAWSEYTESLKKLVRDRIEALEVKTFEAAATVLADTISEEIDAGFEFSDEQLEHIATVLEAYEA